MYNKNFRLFYVVVEGPQGSFCPFASAVFLRRLMGELGTPKVAQIFACGNAPICTTLLHGASDLDRRRLNTQHSEQGCAFLGCERCSPKFLESKPPKKLKFWFHEKDFQALMTKIQTLITSSAADHNKMFT